MVSLIICRLFAGMCMICVLGAEDHPDSVAEQSILWKQHVSSRLASPPHLKDDVVWIPLVKGGLEARSTADGRRLFRLKTRNEVKLFALSGDSLCAARFGKGGRVWLLANNPPRLLSEIETPSRLLDLDVRGSDIALLMSGPTTSEIRAGRLLPLKPLQLAGAGWSDIHIISETDGAFNVLVGRREGSVAMLSPGGSVEKTFRMGGGIQYLMLNSGYVIFGRNGMIARMNNEMNPLWTRDLSYSIQTDPVYVTGDLLVPLRNRTIVRLSSVTGNVIARYNLASPLACPMVDLGSGIAYSATDGIITIVSETNPESHTRVIVGDRIAGMAGDHGFLYVTTERGDLICYSLN